MPKNLRSNYIHKNNFSLKKKQFHRPGLFLVRISKVQVPNMPNICLRPQNTVLRTVSHQWPNTEFQSTDSNGHFVVETKVVEGHQVQVFHQPNNQVLIVGDDNIEFSFTIGRADWMMACVTYAEVPAHEQIAFGRDELIVNIVGASPQDQKSMHQTDTSNLYAYVTDVNHYSTYIWITILPRPV